jgi:hypothetical protein
LLSVLQNATTSLLPVLSLNDRLLILSCLLSLPPAEFRPESAAYSVLVQLLSTLGAEGAFGMGQDPASFLRLLQLVTDGVSLSSLIMFFKTRWL